jgi:hypothetical protein
VRGAVHLVRARLRDDVDEAALRAAELRVRAVGDHDHLFDGVEIERERGTLAAALLAEERIVEVGAVDGDVVGDALLSVDRKLVAVRPLHDGHAGRELGELEEVAAVVRQIGDRFLAEPRGPFRARRFDERRLGGDDDLFRDRGLRQRELDGARLADAELDALHRLRIQPAERGLHFIRAEWQQHAAETALCIRDLLLFVVRGRVAQRDGDARQRDSRRIDDDAFDDAGRGLGLCEESGSENDERDERE